MKFRALRYSMLFLAILIGYFSLWFGGVFVFALPLFTFGLVPLGELFLKPDKHNLDKAQMDFARKDSLYDFMVYLTVPVQYGMLVFFFVVLAREGNAWWEILGYIWTFGISCSVLGINAAHELGHRHKKHEQFLSKMLLLTTLYLHFFIEHNRGHHLNVSTPNDPASSKRGEILYTFFFRSVINSWLSAWKLENARLKRKGHSVFSMKNEMLVYQFIQAGLLLLIYLLAGWQSMLFFVAAATAGFLLLEVVNYIEHYGLQRNQLPNGRYEPTRPEHSWNSNHVLGRYLLFELSRHSDHHFRPGRKYQMLRHFEQAPQMPTGYPGMMVLALFPPLWFWIMHRRIDAYHLRTAGEVQSAVTSSSKYRPIFSP